MCASNISYLLDKRAVDAEIKQEQMANDTNWKAWLQNMP
jgi:hypothetical protein